jgi:hypothetical protein
MAQRAEGAKEALWYAECTKRKDRELKQQKLRSAAERLSYLS